MKIRIQLSHFRTPIVFFVLSFYLFRLPGHVTSQQTITKSDLAPKIPPPLVYLQSDLDEEQIWEQLMKETFSKLKEIEDNRLRAQNDELDPKIRTERAKDELPEISSAAPNVTSSMFPSLPGLPSRDFFSISERVTALRGILDSIMSIEKDLTWNPIVPSRMSRGFFLIKLFSNLMKVMPFQDFVVSARDGITSRASCLTCNILANVFTSRLFTTDIIAFSTRAVCVVARLQTPRVCYGLINSFRDVLDYVRLNSRLAPSEMCGVFLGSTCAFRTSDNLNWTISIPEKNLSQPPPSSSLNNVTSNVSPRSRKGVREVFEVAQITDIHFDPYFSPGTRSDCGEPVCCRSVNGPAATLAQMAGIWGDYTDCDTPYFTVDAALKQVASEHPKASYWLMTGDLPPHDVWEYNQNETLAHIRFMTWMIRVHSRRTPVFPVIGNHEAVPINSFAPLNVPDKRHSSAWLYNYAADQWSEWLSKDALDTFRQGGHYAVKIKPGFRLLVLNSNYCSRLNPWMLYEPIDPGNQLQWLADQLDEAEKSGDNVHIAGHVPPDHRECTQSWLWNYVRLIERYQDIVRAQFYGHTHRDEFRVIYGLQEPKEPIGYQIISPSITSYSQTNPGYRVYKVDGQNLDVLDFETFFFNLTESNTRSTNLAPTWVLEYKSSDTFGFRPINSTNLDKYLNILNSDPLEFEQYYRRYYVMSEVDIAKVWDLTRRGMILDDHKIHDPRKVSPASIIPALN